MGDWRGPLFVKERAHEIFSNPGTPQSPRCFYAHLLDVRVPEVLRRNTESRLAPGVSWKRMRTLIWFPKEGLLGATA